MGNHVKLHIGTIDVPEPYGKLSTFEVAELLEKNYHLFSGFFEKNSEFISKKIESGIALSIEELVNGRQRPSMLGNVVNTSLTTKLKEFIYTSEAEKSLTGTQKYPIPTAAAQEGKTFRTKNRKTKQYKKVRGRKVLKKEGVPRPSFIYSGTLKNSVKCWID